MVTGGASGIGAAVVRRLADAGVRVSVWDVQEDAARGLSAELRGKGCEVLPLRVDVSRRGEVERAAERTREALGAVSFLVHSAGIAGFAPFLEMREEDWDRMLAVHLKGAFHVARACLPDMVGAGFGRIVFVGSVGGLRGGVGLAHYAAAKAGLVGLAKSLAQEFAPRGVTVNVVAPGIVDTPLLTKSGVPREILEKSVERNPIPRMGTPEEVAAACLFFLSDEAGFCTGQVLSPSGGGYL